VLARSRRCTAGSVPAPRHGHSAVHLPPPLIIATISFRALFAPLLFLFPRTTCLTPPAAGEANCARLRRHYPLYLPAVPPPSPLPRPRPPPRAAGRHPPAGDLCLFNIGAGAPASPPAIFQNRHSHVLSACRRVVVSQRSRQRPRHALFSPRSVSCFSLAPQAALPRAIASRIGCRLARARMYVFGGCGEGGGSSNDFFQLDTDTLDMVGVFFSLAVSTFTSCVPSPCAFLASDDGQEYTADEWSDAAAAAAAHHVRREGQRCYRRCFVNVACCVFPLCDCPPPAAGGWNGVSALRDVYVFDIHSCAWSEAETKGVTWNGWSGSAFALAHDGVSLLVFGGRSSSQVRQLQRFWRARSRPGR